MTKNYASIHLKAEDKEKLLLILEEEFSKKPYLSRREQSMLYSIWSMSENSIGRLGKNERDQSKRLAEIRSLLRDCEKGLLQEKGERAVVVSDDYVSIYSKEMHWENVEDIALEYSELAGCPVMGLAVYEGNNFLIILARDGKIAAKGTYFFDGGDIERLDVDDFLKGLGDIYKKDEFSEIFDCADGYQMERAFEYYTNIPVRLENAGENPPMALFKALETAMIYKKTGDFALDD